MMKKSAFSLKPDWSSDTWDEGLGHIPLSCKDAVSTVSVNHNFEDAWFQEGCFTILVGGL